LKIEYPLFLELTSSICHYCGARPANVRKISRSDDIYVYNGLDRKDAFGGYVADNVVPCCWRCNRMKSTMSKEEFLELLRTILIRLAND
jgi:hypothetical protein